MLGISGVYALQKDDNFSVAINRQREKQTIIIEYSAFYWNLCKGIGPSSALRSCEGGGNSTSLESMGAIPNFLRGIDSGNSHFSA